MFNKLLTLYGSSIIKSSDWYYAAGSYLPLSVSEADCIALGRLIGTFDIQNAFVLGDAFGFSSNYIALVMEKRGGSLVVTLDNYSEGNADHVLNALRGVSLDLHSVRIKRVTGTSPQDVLSAADGAVFDLCFIDGNHSGEHPLEDFKALLEIAHEGTIFAWHDGNCVDVIKSIDYARSIGYTCFSVETPGFLHIGSKDPLIKEKYGD